MGKRRTKKGWYVLNTEKSQSFLQRLLEENERHTTITIAGNCNDSWMGERDHKEPQLM